MELVIANLSLKGFQVFRDRVDLPLSRVNFLYGPNSAGKSAIVDAIDIIRDVFWYPKPFTPFDTYPLKRFNRIKKDWRREGSGHDYAEECLIGIEGSITTKIPRALASYFTGMEIKEYKKADEYRVGLEVVFREAVFDEVDNDEVVWSVSRDFSISIDNVDLINLVEFDKIGINFDHEILSPFKLQFDYAELSKKYPDIVHTIEGWIWFKGENIRVDKDKKFDLQFFLNESVINDIDGNRRLLDSLNEFKQYFDNIIDLLLGNFSITSDLVPASREIPSPSDLSFLVPCGWENSDESVLEKYGFSSSEDNKFRPLAESFAATVLSCHEYVMPLYSDIASDVNHLLSDYLFIDKGYQIGFDYHVIIRSEDFDEILDSGYYEESSGKHALIVQLFLRDHKDIRYSFHDVGSGLGYILPVLCIITAEGGIAHIQQPELHLHPALQASLGDVFIETSRFKQQIIETHSEYILLRILKRIRQTNSGGPLAEELKLTSNDVSILYFEPGIDGSTDVKRIRVSRDGEFMDRWPKGFFEERYSEIFDE